MSTRRTGDEGEQFVADYLRNIGFVVELHPRTFRKIHVKGGREIYISQNNDYHNAFDIKAEGIEQMIYVQVKVMPDGTVSSGHISDARDNIDRNYPYSFGYVRIQVWQVWKEWASLPKRHKEFKFRIWERTGDKWNELTPSVDFYPGGRTASNEPEGIITLTERKTSRNGGKKK